MAVLNFFTEPTNIFECLLFIQWQQFVLCCNGFCRLHGRYIINKWTAFYSLGFAGCAVLGLSYTIYAKVNNVEQEKRISALDNLLLSIVCLELVMSTCVFLITAVSMQYQARRHIAIIERINALDQRLIQEFGANLNYRKLMRKDIIVMAVITAAYFGAVNSAIIQISEGDWPLTFMGTWCYAVITGGPHFSGFVHMNTTEVLRIRFRLLQRIIHRDFLLLRFPDVVLRERRLYGAIDLVKEFHEMIREVNAVYMLSMISALAHDFTLTTSELYMIFGSKNFSPKILFYVILCMLPPFYKIIMAPIYCHKAIAEVSVTKSWKIYRKKK